MVTERDDFREEVKRWLAQRVGLRCSNPDCGAVTSGPSLNSDKATNVGIAGHITGAAPGGPRYNPELTQEQRSSSTNGIWLCRNCAGKVDADVSRYTESLLQGWKRGAEARALAALGQATTSVEHRALSVEELDILIASAKSGQIAILSGSWQKFVRADTETFGDPSDPAVAAAYLEALQGLIARGLVTHEAGVAYRLTGAGFSLARALAA
jgi:hypothetical protein